MKFKAIQPLDVNASYNDNLVSDSEVFSRQRSWSTVAFRVNTDRLLVIFALHLSHSRVEKDSAIGATGSIVYMALCRASLAATIHHHFLCDEWFIGVTPDSVRLELSVDDDLSEAVVRQQMANLCLHIDGFVTDTADGTEYCLKGKIVFTKSLCIFLLNRIHKSGF